MPATCKLYNVNSTGRKSLMAALQNITDLSVIPTRIQLLIATIWIQLIPMNSVHSDDLDDRDLLPVFFYCCSSMFLGSRQETRGKTEREGYDMQQRS